MKTTLETGKKKLDMEEIIFGDIIKDLALIFEEKLMDKNIALVWLPDDETTTLVAENISFRMSVLYNLLSNAITFSPRGSRIEIRCREINSQTRIDLRDYGSGIPRELRENLFSTTHQTNRIGTEGESGTGFGMPLVQFYISLYGGSISFVTKTKDESLTDLGTTFTIILKK